jgi:type IV pilus assembly protein PilM
MRPKGKPIIGIELNEDEIRIAEVCGSWTEPTLLRTASAPAPLNAFADGVPVDLEAVAAALRALVGRSGSSARNAVVALPPQLTTCRIVETPNVPVTEMATVIRGELVHLQIVREEGSTFDYARLSGEGSAPDQAASVLVMAAEEAIVERYATIVSLAGLNPIGAEPLLLAMLRTTGLMVRPDRETLAIAVNANAVEIAIVGGTDLRFYRRLDLGCHPASKRREPAPLDQVPIARELRSLQDERFALQGASSIAIGEESAPEAEGDAADLLGARMLALDLQRSLDYCAGRFQQTEPVVAGLLVLSDPEMRPLAGKIAEALGIEITLSVPMIAAGPSAGEEAPDLRFQPAIGLAMRSLTGAGPPLPSFDLSPKTRSRGAIRLRNGSPLAAAALSALILAVGGGIGIQATSRAGLEQASLIRARATLTQRTQEQADLSQRIQGRVERLRDLSARGYPIATVADEVAEAVPPGVALETLRVEAGGRLLLTGEAADERAVIRALDRLKTSRHLADVSLESFDRGPDRSAGPDLIRFQVAAQIAASAAEAGGAR